MNYKINEQYSLELFETKRDAYIFIPEKNTFVGWTGYIYDIPEDTAKLLGYNSTLDIIKEIKVKVQYQVEQVSVIIKN